MADINPRPTEPISPVTTFNTAELDPTPIEPSNTAGTPLYPTGVPLPSGTVSAENSPAAEGQAADGSGVDGEMIVWQSRYSKRNFIGRTVFRGLLTVAWLALAKATWLDGYTNLTFISYFSLTILVVVWLVMIFRVVQSHYSHYYKLTNRRLFVSTGVLNRQRDMMELLRVKDVFTRQQSILERWLALGTVVVVPTEKELPTFYLAGVNQPKQLMDLIWHQARAERDNRSVKVDSV